MPIPERRRCPNCETKSYSKYVGRYEMSMYECKKCHTRFDYQTATLEILQLIRLFGYKTTLRDVYESLKNAPAEQTFEDFMKMIGKEIDVDA